MVLALKTASGGIAAQAALGKLLRDRVEPKMNGIFKSILVKSRAELS